MRLYLLVTFVLMSLMVSAATLDSNQNIPQCAVTCQNQTLAEHSSCSASDLPCLCNDTNYQSTLSDCVKQKCPTREALTAKRYRLHECGVPKHHGYPVADPGTIAPMVLATLLFAIRMTAKFMGLGGGWGPDDYTIIVAWGLSIIIFSLNASSVHYGFGKHMWDIIPQDNITKGYKLFYAYALLYKIEISLAKISVCLFLLRIFRSTAFRYITYTIMGINTAIALAWVFSDAFRCKPVHLAWTGWENAEPGKCINFSASTAANGFVNIVVDATMVVVPIFEVMKLNLSWRKKLGVALMFAVGLVLTVIGILRVVVLYQHHRWNNDPTVTLAPVNYWSTIEVQVTIICACLPLSRALFVHLFPQLGGSHRKSYPYPTGPSTKGGLSSRAQGASQIAKTVSYSVKYTSEPQRRDSDSMVQLVEVGQNSHE